MVESTAESTLESSVVQGTTTNNYFGVCGSRVNGAANRKPRTGAPLFTREPHIGGSNWDSSLERHRLEAQNLKTHRGKTIEKLEVATP